MQSASLAGREGTEYSVRLGSEIPHESDGYGDGIPSALQEDVHGVRRFEDLVAWQLAMELCDVVHELTETGKAARDFEFRGQIRTASSKIAPLIAEGFIRYTPREFVRYLRMARAETGEVQTHLEKARRRSYFPPDQQARVTTLANRTMGTITNLLKAKLKQIGELER